jgi:hypothetical protein
LRPRGGGVKITVLWYWNAFGVTILKAQEKGTCKRLICWLRQIFWGLACRDSTHTRPFEIKHCLNHLEFAICVEVFKGQKSIMVGLHFECQKVARGGYTPHAFGIFSFV